MQRPPPEAPGVDSQSVLALTATGRRALLEAGTTLRADELAALVLIDDHSTVAQIERRGKDLPQARLLLSDLVRRGYVQQASSDPDGMIDPGDFFGSTANSPEEFLRRDGYSVNIARRAQVKRAANAQPLHILVIDDDAEIGMLLRKYLKLEGIETRTAGNPADIAAAMRATPLPDLVLLDIDLAGVDGFHVLQRMRAYPALRGIPVLIVTGTATREMVLKGLLLGIDGHVTKPFRIHALVRAVKAVLGLQFDPNEEDWDLSL